VVFHRHWLDPPPRLKVCKVFEKKGLSLDFTSGIKYGSPAWYAGLPRFSLNLRVTGASRTSLWKMSWESYHYCMGD
jgi:hypothetical protein